LEKPIQVQLKTTVTPPLENTDGLKPFEPVKNLELKIPEAERVEFDPISMLPADGKISFTVTLPAVELIELPEYVEANVGSSFVQPWGYKTVKDKTRLDFQVEAQGDFSMDEGQSSQCSAVSMELSFTVECSLSGEGSMKFTLDGLPRPTPTLVG